MSHAPSDRSAKHPMHGLLVSLTLGAFNDNAWKQIIALLAMATVASEAAKQREAAFTQLILMIPLMLFSMPAGVLADRLSKRSVILAMKGLELALMLVGTVTLYYYPSGGSSSLMILLLLGVQAALFSPAKYGILPEILPHERLSSANGLMEMCTNLAIIGGIVAGGVIVSATSGQPWLGGLTLSVLSAAGFVAALAIPWVPTARAEGGLAATVRIAWSAIRGDRILRLAIVGQIFVWSIASLVPAPILSYSKKSLRLEDSMTGLPLAALGIGIGIGCVLAGRLSASKVEYGLLPLGALGLTLSALGFALIGPDLKGMIVLMGLLGIFAGLMFVPLNALIQWRAPEDGRGAVIALANTVVYVGMFAGTLLAMVMASAGISARGTFLGASIVLALGFFWALWLVPDAFMRFLLIMLAQTVYRLRVIGRRNVPLEGGALLTPNHVSFADGLFVIASIDRPVRFVVYADYFRSPILGPFLRAIRAIPISGAGGPKMILQAFREAGRSLDEGELVCVFPEGQITRTGMLQPFRRGLERIIKGRSVPIIPVHIDRATGSIFSPVHERHLPERIPFPVTVSFGAPMPAETPLHEIRQAIHELDQDAWAYRKEDRRPLHREFIRQARRHPFRLTLADVTRPRVSRVGALIESIALARAFRPRWAEQPCVGILLPTGVAGILANLAATTAGRAVVNLDPNADSAAMTSQAVRAGLRTIVISRAYLAEKKLSLPDKVELIEFEEVRDAIRPMEWAAAMLLACLAPARLIERAAGAIDRTSVDDTATVIFTSGSTDEAKGVVLSHFNIDSNVVAINEVFRIRPEDRILDILPLSNAFGYMAFWLALDRGIALLCHPNPKEAATVGDLVQRFRATILLATPAFLQLYLRRCSPAQFGSLRLVIAGAEKLSEPLARAFEDAFGIRPLEGYGMTECSPVVAVSTHDYRAAGFFQPGSRRGFVGHPLPGVSVRVVDPETGEALGPNTSGVVEVKGPNVMRGYLGRHDLTAAALRDGWYVSGDLGLLDEDGFLKINGRLARASKIGGEFVEHGRVEEALQRAAGAEDQIFVVTSVVDDGLGERLVVLHTLGDNQVDDLIEKVGASGLPEPLIPRRDHFIKVDVLPALGNGKLDLRAIQRIAVEALAFPRREGIERVAAGRD